MLESIMKNKKPVYLMLSFSKITKAAQDDMRHYLLNKGTDGSLKDKIAISCKICEIAKSYKRA